MCTSVAIYMSPLGSTCSGRQYDAQAMQQSGQLKAILGTHASDKHYFVIMYSLSVILK